MIDELTELSVAVSAAAMDAVAMERAIVMRQRMAKSPSRLNRL